MLLAGREAFAVLANAQVAIAKTEAPAVEITLAIVCLVTLEPIVEHLLAAPSVSEATARLQMNAHVQPIGKETPAIFVSYPPTTID